MTDTDGPCIPGFVCFNEEKVSHLRSELPDEDRLGRMAMALKAVAHPGRLAVLHLVANEECCVCDVGHTLKLPVSTASQHLRRLKLAGLLRSRQEGKLVFYSLTDHPLAALVADGESV